MSQYIIHNGMLYSADELYHYGTKGMKWGVRKAEYQSMNRLQRKRTRTAYKIDKMYDRTHKWNQRKINKYLTKGKLAKAKALKELDRQNEQARKEKISFVKKSSAAKFKQAVKRDRRDSLFAQQFMRNNQSRMTTGLSRLNEYTTQRGMRWALKYTKNSTLSNMSAKDGLNYVKNKHEQERSSR